MANKQPLLEHEGGSFDVEEVCEKAEDTVEIEVGEACFNKATDKFRSLLKIGKNEILFAIRSCNAKIVEKILEFGVNLNKVEDAKGQSALRIAIERNNLPIVKLLLKHGADPNHIDKLWSSPIHYTVDSEIIKELLKYGAEVDSKDSIGMTPLMRALAGEKFEIAKIFLDHGANINHCDNDGLTALHEASNTGQLETIEFLLKHGANVDAIDDEKCTPLHLAARRNNEPFWEDEQPEAVKILLKNGANPNLKDIDLKTGLHYAVIDGNLEIVRLYFEYAANLDLCIRDYDGNTIIEGALNEKDFPIMKMMAFHQSTI